MLPFLRSTGGVRCERASAYLKEKGEGFEEVFQLKGELRMGLDSPSVLPEARPTRVSPAQVGFNAIWRFSMPTAASSKGRTLCEF